MAQPRRATLREIRSASGLTVRQVAAATGVPATTYFRHERRSAEEPLPLDLADRLIPVFKDFGVDPAYVRALTSSENPSETGVGLGQELPPLQPTRLSPFEKAEIKRRIANWGSHRDFKERERVIERMRQPIEALIGRMSASSPVPFSTDDASHEAYIALMEAIDKGGNDQNLDFEQAVESEVIERLARFIADFHFPLGGPENSPIRSWHQQFRAKIWIHGIVASVGMPDYPIPIYGAFKSGPASVSLLTSAPLSMRVRPQKLAGRPYVYGFFAPDHSLSPRYAARDLILVDLEGRSDSAREVLVSEIGFDHDKQVIRSSIARTEHAPYPHVLVVSSHSDAETRQVLRSDVIAHQLLRIQDLV